MTNIEVEVRSFVTKEQYQSLIQYFSTNAKLIKEDEQESFYFDCKQDLRIQKNNFYAKIWMKKGELHDDHREEIEIKFPREDFEKLEHLFLGLGLKVDIKWLRKRMEYLREDITVCLDYTKGYGYIIELEMMSSEDQKVQVYERLKHKLRALGVEITPKESFAEKYNYYKEHWQELINE